MTYKLTTKEDIVALVDYGDDEWLALAEKLMAERDAYRQSCNEYLNQFPLMFIGNYLPFVDAEAARIMEKESK